MYPGNVRFKDIVTQYLQRYLECPTKYAKSFIVTEIIRKVREASPVGGFVKKVGGRWHRADDKLAREKVGTLSTTFCLGSRCEVAGTNVFRLVSSYCIDFLFVQCRSMPEKPIA